MPDKCILTSDSGSAANWFARDLKIRRGMMATLSGNLATMGPGVPYAIAAKFAWPDRVAIALVGDGAMLMNGINGLITIAKYWKEWSDPRLIVMVLANHDLNQVTWEQRIMSGDPNSSRARMCLTFLLPLRRLLGLEGDSKSTNRNKSAPLGTRRSRRPPPCRHRGGDRSGSADFAAAYHLQGSDALCRRARSRLRPDRNVPGCHEGYDRDVYIPHKN